MRQSKPILHGRDHGYGGADPIPGVALGATADLPTIKAMYTSSDVADGTIVGFDLDGVGVPWDGFLYTLSDVRLTIDGDGMVTPGLIIDEVGAGLYLVHAAMRFKDGGGTYRSFRILSNDGLPVGGFITDGTNPDAGGFSPIVTPDLVDDAGFCYTSASRVSNGYAFPSGVKIEHDGTTVKCSLTMSWTLIYRTGVPEPNYSL